MTQAGQHHIYNALAAAAAASALGIKPSVIARGLSSFTTLSGRTQIIRLKNGSFLINDAYNANPLSVRVAIETLGDLKGRGDSIIILGDMLELGEQAEAFHEEVGSFIAAHRPAALFLKGDHTRYTARGACKGGLPGSQIFFFGEPDEVLTYLKKHLKKGQWILVKGSRKMQLDELVRRISDEIGVENEPIKDLK